MSNHLVQIGKHKFVCGLFWQSLSQPRMLEKEAAELAKRIDSDLMVLRKDHAAAQAGFAQTRDGAKKMAFSLAAAVSKTVALEGAVYEGEKQQVHNWLGAFKLPDGKWAYFAVRDANFLPNGDFAGTKEEVLERLYGDYGLGGWNVVIGDAELEEYGFHNFSAKRIEDLLPKKKNGQLRAHSWWCLRPVERQIPWIPVAIGGLLILMVAGGVGYYVQQYRHRLAEEARLRALEAARIKPHGKAADTGVPHPWVAQPAPSVVVQACLDNLDYLTAGGWSLDNYVCAGNQAIYSWSRQGSTAAFLLEVVPGAVIDLNGEKATYARPLNLKGGDDENLQDEKNLVPSLVSQFQLMDLTPRISKMPPPPPPPQNSLSSLTKREIPLPDWQTLKFSVSSGALPLREIAVILNQPGVRLEKLTYQGGAWTIEGVMYAK